MEDFKRKQKRDYQNMDEMAKQLNRISKQNLQTTQLSFEKSTKVAEKNTTINRLMLILQTYGLGFLAIINSAILYPPSVKLVKKLFNLRGFWNIHFAILPIIGHGNALVLGALQGLLNTYRFRSEYPLEHYKNIDL